MHANSCFKKGCECRFFLPKHLSRTTEVIFDEGNMVAWHYVDIDEPPANTCAFEIFPQRLVADQYLNVHNQSISEVIGCNTNVQLGDPVHSIYTTLYASKTTQKEDTKRHLAIGNHLTRRINRARQDDSIEEESGPDFVEGLARVMTGIRAHLSAHVVSATMGHLLVRKESRFEFSHEFSQLPLSQMEDHADDKPVSFLARTATVAQTDEDGDDEGDNAEGAEQNPGAPPSMGAISNEYGLDEKQKIAYEVICCTYLLRVIQEEATAAAVNSAFTALDDQTSSQKEELIESLKARGGMDQLLMFLTGAGGCGKSHCVYAARKFCHRFSQAAGIVFEKNTFWFTACTGSAAAIWGGVTIHSAAKLNCKQIYDEYREDWKNVRLLIIDEISYFSENDLKKLDRCLKKLANPELLYGGISIVFAGDFHQMEPVANGKPLYSFYSGYWQ